MRSHPLTQSAPPPTFTPALPGLLQRCVNNRESVRQRHLNPFTAQRRMSGHDDVSEAPAIAHEFAALSVPTDNLTPRTENTVEGKLPEPTRRKLERQFNTSLDDVKVYSGEEGRRITAQHAAIAVSTNNTIYLSPDAGAPGTEQGDRVLRHEITHYLQQQAGSYSGGSIWPNELLEAEADRAALQPHESMTVRGRGAAAIPLFMKTFVSTVGGNPYLDQAVKFYKLWENETAIRVGAYQDIVNDLAKEKSVLDKFRIVAHANGLNLFLPLLSGGEKEYAQLPALGLQTREAVTVQFGKYAHIAPDITGDVHKWLKATTDGKALLGRLGLGAVPSGVWREWIWWVVDEYYAGKVQEDPPKTTAKERDQLKQELQTAQKAVKQTVLAVLPSTAAPADVEALRTQTLAVLQAQSPPLSKVPEGFLKEKLDRLQLKDVVAFRKEVETGTLEGNLKAVKQRVSDKTYIEIRGCNIGQNDAYLNGIREFFGTKPDKLPAISAPKLYQFFGNPGVLILPQSGKAAAPALQFLFDEAFTDQSLAKDVKNAVEKAGMKTIADLLSAVLRATDVKAEFEAWWKMKQTAKGVAPANLKSATLQDFQDFLSTAPPRTFPVYAPAMSQTNALWYFILLPSTAIDAILAWLKDQGYQLPAGADMRKTFFKGASQLSKKTAKTFETGIKTIVVDWLGDKYPVPDKIYFPEDPTYKANIRKLP